MTSVFVDDYGTPIIQPNGMLATVDGEDEVKQFIVSIFSTILGTEPFHPRYGIDYYTLIRIPPFVDRAAYIRAMTYMALNPEISPLIDNVSSVDVEIEGKNAYIDIVINSVKEEVKLEL